LLALAAAAAVCLALYSGCPAVGPEVENLGALVPLPPPPQDGETVDVGGYDLFYKKAGSAETKVVLVSGLDENIKIWDKVYGDIADFATVVAYDRGGVGWSDEGKNPRTASVIAEEMDAFLRAVGIDPPYILCAHSLGGLYARYYATTYPDRVSGLLLLDTSHEDMWRRQALQLPPAEVAISQLMMGVAQGVEGFVQVGAMGEYYNLENTTYQVRNERQLPNIPLLLLSQDIDNFEVLEEDPQANTAQLLFREFYWEQASLTPQGKWIEVQNTSHFIMVDQPQEVIDGLKWVIEQVEEDE
jgi:pimeloyl-ACP methyl ester carboxylesterase